MIGANKAGHVFPRPKSFGSDFGTYNIKGKVNRKFLQYEKQGAFGGINLGWTDNASATTATKRAKWFFRRKVGESHRIALRYGEVIALGWSGRDKPFVKYSQRNVGINLNWSSKPSFEWAILGGRPGTKVRTSQDWVILYNVKRQCPLHYFDRTVGGDIGWRGSSRWGLKSTVLGHNPYPELVKPLMK